MCFFRKRIWSSTVIIDFLQSFDNQKKTIGNFATYDPLMHCLSYKEHSRSYADHMFINHMISKLPIRFTVLLTYFNSNTFYKKNALLLLLYSYWWNKNMSEGNYLKTFDILGHKLLFSKEKSKYFCFKIRFILYIVLHL